jgi:hypothetical protein
VGDKFRDVVRLQKERADRPEQCGRQDECRDAWLPWRSE